MKKPPVPLRGIFTITRSLRSGCKDITPLILVIAGLLLAIGTQPLHAGWIRSYGDQMGNWEAEGRSIYPTSDGGYIACAYYWFLVSERIWVLKTNSEGDTVWTRKYVGHAGWDDTVLQAADGGFIITGTFYSSDPWRWDVWLFKLSGDGNILWEKFYSSNERSYDYGQSLQQTSDGGYIISGTFSSDSTGCDVWLIKTDMNGDTLWTKTYDPGEEKWMSGYCVKQTADGGYIISTNLGLVTEDAGLIKTDSLGTVEWTRIYEGKGTGWHVEPTMDGGYLIATEYRVIKTDSIGDIIWEKDYGGHCVRQTSDGGYIIAKAKGLTWELVKTDTDGEELWGQNYGICINSVRQTDDGGYILTGYKDFFLWLIKTDSLGYVSLAEEPPVTPVTHPSNWQISASIGPQITLRYTNHPQGFHAFIFDAVGRRVAEIHSAGTSGTITWGDGHKPGVYFIRVESGASRQMQKVVLIR